MRHTHLAVVAAVLATTSACFKVQEPVRTSFFEGPSRDTLVIMLPGFGASDRTFDRKDIIEVARAAGLQADVMSVNTHYGYYAKAQIIPRLREDVIEDVRERYEHVWVLGISMGGLGALLTAEAFPDVVDGVILLSPFLGRKRTLASVMEAPSLGSWQAPAEPAWDEELWTWLTALERDPDALPPILLGYGTADLSPSHLAFLAGHLPPERVRITEGGHTWSTWRELVDAFMREDLSKRPAFAPARAAGAAD